MGSNVGVNDEAATVGTRLRRDSSTDKLADVYETGTDGAKLLRVGSLGVSTLVLGYGSQGTVVFKGSLNGRPVAVKRMLAQFSKAAERYEQLSPFLQPVA